MATFRFQDGHAKLRPRALHVLGLDPQSAVRTPRSTDSNGRRGVGVKIR